MSNNDSILTYSTETGSRGEFVAPPFAGTERPCDATPGCSGTIRQPADDIYEDCDTCGWGERVDCCHECAGIDLPDEDRDDRDDTPAYPEHPTVDEDGNWLAVPPPASDEEKEWTEFINSLS